MTLIPSVAIFSAALVLPTIAHPQTGVPQVDRDARIEQHRGKGAAAQEESNRGFVSTPIGGARYELTFAGQHFTSRDQVEGYLLYRAARVARESGYTWFVLLHLPGERGLLDHPARQSPSFGAAYGNWQPHWSYRLSGQEWQPWHPEWGTPFWTDVVPRGDVEQFEVHAMIEVRHGAFPGRQPSAFSASRVIRDLGTRFDSVGASAP